MVKTVEERRKTWRKKRKKVDRETARTGEERNTSE